MQTLCDDCAILTNAPVGIDAHVNLYTICRQPAALIFMHVCGECDAFWEYFGGRKGMGWRKVEQVETAH